MGVRVCVFTYFFLKKPSQQFKMHVTMNLRRDIAHIHIRFQLEIYMTLFFYRRCRCMRQINMQHCQRNVPPDSKKCICMSALHACVVIVVSERYSFNCIKITDVPLCLKRMFFFSFLSAFLCKFHYTHFSFAHLHHEQFYTLDRTCIQSK